LHLTAREPELRLGSAGEFQFQLPLASDLIDRFRGERIAVRVDGLAFAVAVDDLVAIPAAARSLQEAKYFAAAISFQILAVLHERGEGRGIRRPAKVLAFPRVADRAINPDSHSADRSLTISSLFERWSRHHLSIGGAPTTPPYWSTLVGRFIGFLGHDDPLKVTTATIRAYREHLVGSGRHIRTARDSDLAALRSLFRFGVENDLLPADPTAGVRFRSGRLAENRKMLAFTDHEATTILEAADHQTIPARRWVPWLTAFTGSRVATMVNLRREDVIRVDGIWCVRISRGAGPVKTTASERIVPIHPAILQRGFIDFVQTCDRERLFIASSPRIGADGAVIGGAKSAVYYPGRTTYNRMTEWIHSLGLDIGRSAGKDPNHAWRHWFKEKAFSVGIPEKITDAIVGHAQISAARRYGSVTIELMLAELRKIPSPLLEKCATLAINNAIGAQVEG
jgi:site-specific recombinase XerD